MKITDCVSVFTFLRVETIRVRRCGWVADRTRCSAATAEKFAETTQVRSKVAKRRKKLRNKAEWREKGGIKRKEQRNEKGEDQRNTKERTKYRGEHTVHKIKICIKLKQLKQEELMGLSALPCIRCLLFWLSFFVVFLGILKRYPG